LIDLDCARGLSRRYASSFAGRRIFVTLPPKSVMLGLCPLQSVKVSDAGKRPSGASPTGRGDASPVAIMMRAATGDGYRIKAWR
jgi:hypothetical protein